MARAALTSIPPCLHPTSLSLLRVLGYLTGWLPSAYGVSHMAHHSQASLMPLSRPLESTVRFVAFQLGLRTASTAVNKKKITGRQELVMVVFGLIRHRTVHTPYATSIDTLQDRNCTPSHIANTYQISKIDPPYRLGHRRIGEQASI